VPIDADITNTLVQPGVTQCDVIFGPLYTKQVTALAAFTTRNNIKMVIPFSINGNDVDNFKNIYQVYQSPADLNVETIKRFADRFAGYQPVIFDCNDKTSDKGPFTSGLRKVLDERGITYKITNLESSYDQMSKAFSLDKPNVVILNTGRSPELNQVIAKLDALTTNNKNLKISLFGYTEWLIYERYNLENFFKYDTYVPTHFYYNTVSGKTQELETRYRKNFGVSMMEAKPRFALTGYDQAMHFIKGIHEKGSAFVGDEPDKKAVQTQYKFEKSGPNGGMRNKQFMFVHYNRNKSISTIVF